MATLHHRHLLILLDFFDGGGVKHLQICMFYSDFYLQQVQILHLDVRAEHCDNLICFILNE